MTCISDGSLGRGRHGGGGLTIYPGGSTPCPLNQADELESQQARTQAIFSDCRIAPSARALDPLWNLRPNCMTWQSVRSKNSDSISMAYLVGAPGLEPATLSLRVSGSLSALFRNQLRIGPAGLDSPRPIVVPGSGSQVAVGEKVPRNADLIRRMDCPCRGGSIADIMRGDADAKPSGRVPRYDAPDRRIRQSTTLLAYPKCIA